MKAFPEGNVAFKNAWNLPLGKGATVEYVRSKSVGESDSWVMGNWTVQNLGAWPKAGLSTGAKPA